MSSAALREYPKTGARRRCCACGRVRRARSRFAEPWLSASYSAELRVVVPLRDNNNMPPVWHPGGSSKAPAHDPGPSLSHSHSHDGSWTSTPPPTAPTTLRCHSAQHLGTVLVDLGDLASAHTRHERALKIGQATPPPQPPHDGHLPRETTRTYEP